MTTESRYLHGTTPLEQDRLSLLNDILNEGSLRELGVRPGERVLDVGSGLGQLTFAIAEATGPTGTTLGVERSAEQLEIARSSLAERNLPQVELRAGDATALPLRDEEWSSFDVVHTRFLLEHLPRPQRVVDAMVRAARPGGRIVLEDDDHSLMRLWPEAEGFSELWQAYIRAFERLGNDPYIGRRLTSLLDRAGAEPTRNAWIFFGACHGDPRFPAIADNLIGVIHGARPSIVEEELLTPEQFDRALDSLHRWSAQRDAAVWYSVCWAEGRRSD